MSDMPPVQIGERLRSLAEAQPEPVRSLLIRTADHLVALSLEFTDKVMCILLEAELELVERINPRVSAAPAGPRLDTSPS